MNIISKREKKGCYAKENFIFNKIMEVTTLSSEGNVHIITIQFYF